MTDYQLLFVTFSYNGIDASAEAAVLVLQTGSSFNRLLPSSFSLLLRYINILHDVFECRQVPILFTLHSFPYNCLPKIHH